VLAEIWFGNLFLTKAFIFLLVRVVLLYSPMPSTAVLIEETFDASTGKEKFSE